MRPAKLRTFDYLGCHAYSLTLCTFQRQRHFIDAMVVRLVLREILRTADGCGFELPAYCFMPDHLHLLSVGRSPVAHLPSFAKLARQRSAMAFSSRTGRRLWQQGFFERTLRNDEAIEAVARYIEGNPVRAGLVTSVDEWPFTGGVFLRPTMAELKFGPTTDPNTTDPTRPN